MSQHSRTHTTLSSEEKFYFQSILSNIHTPHVNKETFGAKFPINICRAGRQAAPPPHLEGVASPDCDDHALPGVVDDDAVRRLVKAVAEVRQHQLRPSRKL